MSTKRGRGIKKTTSKTNTKKNKKVEVEVDIAGNDSDDEINFCGSMDYFAGVFANCGQPEVEVPTKDLVEVPVKRELRRSRRTSKTKTRSKGMDTLDLTKPDSSLLDNSQDDIDELRGARNVCDELDEFLRNAKSTSARKSPPKHKDSAAKAKKTSKSLSPILVEDGSDTDVLEEVTFIPIEEDFNYINVRVRWRGFVHKFKMFETDKISKLRQIMADAVDLQVDEVAILINEDEALDDKNTLKESNVTIGIVLDAVRLRLTKECTSTAPVPRKQTAVVKDPSMIRLKLQDDTARRLNKSEDLFFNMKRSASFDVLQKLYADKMNLRTDQIVFRFDGDILDFDETPISLELDDDDCLDVLVSS